MPISVAISGAVQCVVSAGGSRWVSATTRSAISTPSGATREGRVLSRNSPSKPSAMNRSCQRQTQVFEVPVWRMISLVPTPSADRRMILARQTCFWGLLRFRATAFKRRRTAGEIVTVIPVRIPQTRTPAPDGESYLGFNCQILSTRSARRFGVGGEPGPHPLEVRSRPDVFFELARLLWGFPNYLLGSAFNHSRVLIPTEKK